MAEIFGTKGRGRARGEEAETLSRDPVLRLAALDAHDADTAWNILYGDEVEPGLVKPTAARRFVQSAVDALHERIEAAIIEGLDEVTIDTSLAELIAMALKDRKRSNGRPSSTARQRSLRKAVVKTAKVRSKELQEQGVRPGDANRRAAVEASARGGQLGDVAAPSTILKEMKPQTKT